MFGNNLNNHRNLDRRIMVCWVEVEEVIVRANPLYV